MEGVFDRGPFERLVHPWEALSRDGSKAVLRVGYDRRLDAGRLAVQYFGHVEERLNTLHNRGAGC
jgi:hypothetical protein